MAEKVVNSIMAFYEKVSAQDDYEWVNWTEKRRRFTEIAANKFFIGVLLDQGQLAERAWEGGAHFVDNYFQESECFWEDIASTHHATLKKICQKGFEGTSYATNFNFNKFPKNLKSAASKIVREFDSDVRNVWNVDAENVDLIYDRFIQFDGLGDALGKMAQFILVRNYGVAGGRDNQANMSIKPDILVRRVLQRSGLTENERTPHAIEVVEKMALDSPADFDAAAWIIGREYCFKSEPNCSDCPISKSCDF